MNVDLYKQMVDLFDFITTPLWEFYNDSYNGYQGAALMGAIILGLIASTYPSQISYHVSMITFCANQMVAKAKWWHTPLGLFLGKLTSVYFIVSLNLWLNGDQIVRVLEVIIKFSGPVYLVLGLSFIFLQWVRRRTQKFHRKRIPSLYKVTMVSFLLSLFIDPGTILIMDIFIPWIERQEFLLGWFIPFFYTFASFMPILIVIILAYGFHGDTFLRNNVNKKSMRYFLGLVLIVLAVNHFVLYW